MNNSILRILITSTFYFVTIFISIPCLSQVLEKELNNTFETADTIHQGSLKNGTVQKQNDPDDYFVTVLPKDGTVKVHVSGVNKGNNGQYLAFYLYDKRKFQGTPFYGYYIGNANEPAGANVEATLNFYGFASDSFYFRITTSDSFAYSISYEVVDTSANDIEPNDDLINALPIIPSEVKQGHVGYILLPNTIGVGSPNTERDNRDYYKLFLPADGNLQVYLKTINYESSDDYLNLYVYDHDGNRVASKVIDHDDRPFGTTFFDTLEISCLERDSFYIEVANSNNDYSAYGAAYSYNLSYKADTQSVKADFDFIALGTQVSLINKSIGANNYSWNFGDGNTDTVSNPTHTYRSGGAYTIRLLTSNGCNNTISKVVNVLTLQNVYPNVGGNTGEVTVNITGGGFTDQTTAKIISNGKEITGTRLIPTDNGRNLQATFDLTNQPLAKWDVVISNTNSKETLKQSFTSENGTGNSLSVSIDGKSVARNGVSEYYDITVSNSGNTDADGTVLWVALPDSSTLSPSNFQLLVDTSIVNTYTELGSPELFEPMHVDSLFEDPNAKANLYGWAVDRISAKSSVKFTVSSAIYNVIGNTKPIKVWISNSLKKLTSKEGLECLQAQLDAISDVKIPFVSNAADCASGIIQNGLTVYDVSGRTDFERRKLYYKILNLKPGTSNIFSEFDDLDGLLLHKYVYPLAEGLLISIYKCKDLRSLKSYPNFTETMTKLKEVTSFNLANAKIPVQEKIIESAKIFLDLSKHDYEIHEKCRAWESMIGQVEKDVRIVASNDPNEKVGPSGNTENNFNQGTSPFNYKIYFENVDTATAPAQEVIVADTLDKSKFDLSTFKLTSFGFGDSTEVSIPAGLSSYFTNVLVHRIGKVDLLVKVDAKLDTTTGILNWRFLSLNPITKELIDDPLDGFLPPNKILSEGKGFISYSIQPKAALLNNTVIKNKAAIYFDNNKPIITNEFINTIDKVNPISKVGLLPAETIDTTFTVQWAGTDAESGVRSYDVYYSINGGSFQLWQYNVTSTQETFTGKADSIYRFYSIARDYAGNIENDKTVAEAITTIIIKKTATVVTSLVATLNADKTVTLTWSTLSESNNKGFDIERKINGQWQTISFIKGVGNSAIKNDYKYVDSTVTAGNTYTYRFKQTDSISNSIVYSNEVIIEIVAGTNNLLSLTTAPNPFTSKTTITYSLPERSNVVMKLVDYSGRRIATLVNQTQEAGSYIKEFVATTYGLATGFYILRLETKNGVVSSKLLYSNR